MWLLRSSPFASEITIPVDAVRVGNLYRVRVRMRDNTGRRSSWSAPVQFVVGPSDNEAAVAGDLQIRRNIAQGIQYERPLVQPGMRQGQPWSVQNSLIVQQ